MIQHLGVGWTFSILTAMVAGCVPLTVAERYWGARIRQTRDVQSDSTITEGQET